MSSFVDAFRAWRRDLKARMPYVRRREYRILRERFDELVEGLGWTARPAAQAHIATLRPLAPLEGGEVCFFVSFAPAPRLKHHVVHHIDQLLRSGVQVVLVVNTDLPADAFEIDPSLADRLSGVFVRENTGFDFAAWAHLHSMCPAASTWTRLYLVNDSIVGPLDRAAFQTMLGRIRASTADVVALTESQLPVPHLQSFFMALNASALRSAALQEFFQRVLSLPTKGQVIDVYETRLTRMLQRRGLRCEAVFAPLSNDPHSSNDTSFRWAALIRAGFPFIKTSILDRHRGHPDIRALVPADLLAGER